MPSIREITGWRTERDWIAERCGVKWMASKEKEQARHTWSLIGDRKETVPADGMQGNGHLQPLEKRTADLISDNVLLSN